MTEFVAGMAKASDRYYYYFVAAAAMMVEMTTMDEIFLLAVETGAEAENENEPEIRIGTVLAADETPDECTFPPRRDRRTTTPQVPGIHAVVAETCCLTMKAGCRNGLRNGISSSC